MNSPRSRHDLLDDPGQTTRRQNGPRANDCSGDSSRPPFFAELVNQIGEGLFTHLIHNISRGYFTPAIHAHVKRSILHQREPPLRSIQLETADAKVSQHSVYRRYAKLL